MPQAKKKRSAAFVGRGLQLAQLRERLDWVRAGGRDQAGKALLLRGRRRVGKSRLVEVFAEGEGVPFLYFTAVKGADPAASVAELLRQAVEESTLSGRQQLEGVSAGDWATALRLIAQVIPDDEPTIVVIDEVPWLADDPAFEGSLQAVWDQYLSRKPVLLVLVGSDLAMMEALSSHGQPFYQRGDEMVLEPLNVAEVADMCGLPDDLAFDAYLITGGLPLVCQDWPSGATPADFLAGAYANPTSPLIVSGERILAAELPGALRPRDVLEAIGDGERTFTNIANAAGVNHATLNNALEVLVTKRLVGVEEPLSAKPGKKDRRFHVADPYLRFWLAHIPRALPNVERGRPDLAMRHWEQSWIGWRGRAIEPAIRASLARLLPDDQFPAAVVLGGWWRRTNTPELDLVAADRRPAREIALVGSIKWRDSAPFDNSDFGHLAADATEVPGADASTALVGVSRNGFKGADGLSARWGPNELVAAWR